MLYRILESLRYLNSHERLEAGTINSLKGVSPASIAMLIAKGRIAEVHPLPLAALPGWEERAKVYAEQGIQDVNDMSSSLLREEGVVDEDDFEEALAEIAEPAGSPEPDPTWSRAEPWDAGYVHEMDDEGELVSRDPRSEEEQADDAVLEVNDELEE